MSKAVTSFIDTSESAQIALMKAAQRGSIYMPQSEEELAAINHYWASAQRVNDGNEALFTARVQLPFEQGTSYIINKKVKSYIELLYVGRTDTTPFETGNYEQYGSSELKEIIANASQGEEIELEGVLKCEALGYSLRYGTINPVNDVVLYRDNPLDGSVTFRVGEAVEAEGTLAATA